MNDRTFLAFGDELVKIAFLQKVRNGFMSALKEGWHGTKENPATWFGQGRKITPDMNTRQRMWEEASSLGGATKALPIGAKSMMMLGTGLMARDALRPQDPSGRDRSRTERLTGLAGNTVGGLVGSSLASRAIPGSRFLAPILGGVAGGMLGERVTTAPFRAARNARMGAQEGYQNQMQQQPMPVNPGVPG
jgi:hypothetical protein